MIILISVMQFIKIKFMFIAPFVLYKHGIAKGKSLTSYPTVKSDIEGSYQYKEDSTVVDGNF